MSELLNRYESLKDATRLAVNETSSLEGVIDDVLTKVVHESIKKYQQKLNVGVEDSVSDLLEAFKQKITESIFDAASTWKIANKEPVMFPRGCRYAYARGTSTIFVVEQDPGVRTLSFDFSYGVRNAERHALAMPYVVFLAHLKNNWLVGLYCGWRTAPLQTLSDLISCPLLPNIHENLAVCMALDLRYENQTVENAISDFWNSTFNNDVSDRWQAKSAVSLDLTTPESWVEKSEENPLFMLELDFGHNKTIQSCIDLLTKHEVEPNEDEFLHRLSESIDACVKTLFSKIMRYFKKTKFEKHSPKDVTETLKSAIIKATGDLTDVVRVLDKEISSLTISNVGKHDLVRVGNLWTNYSP